MESNERADQLERTQRSLESDRFKVLLVGEFKRGKSTAINAMLGARVLPAKVAPCTAVITRVLFGPRKEATLHHRDSDAVTVLDLEVEPEALAQHLVIENAAADTEQQNVPSPYDGAEVRFPLDLLKNNVELVDSPGLNEHVARTALTHSFLAEADAMILVLSCSQFLSQSERKFLDKDLAGRDLSDVFFLCNHFDDIRDYPEDLEELRELAQETLGPRSMGSPRLFFAASNEALAGRLQNRSDLLEESQLPMFLEALERFLSTERGRVKLATPIRLCEHAINEALLHVLPQREALFRQPLAALRKTLEVERPRLDEAQRQCARAMRDLDRRTEAMVKAAQASWRTFLAQLEPGVERHARTVDVSAWDTVVSKAAAGKKFATAMEDWLSDQIHQWERAHLQPLLETQWRDMFAELDDQAREFLQNIEQVRSAFLPSSKKQPDGANVSALSQLLGARLGQLDFGAGIKTAGLGAGAAVEGMVLNVAAFVVLKAMAFTLPVILPVVIAIGLAKTKAGADQAANSIRDHVVKQILAELRRAQIGAEDAIGQQITTAVEPLRTRVSREMSAIVDEIRGQVVSVIAEREQTQVVIEEQLADLAEVRDTLTAQQKRVQQVLVEVG